MKTELAQLELHKDEMRYLVNRVNDKTRDIKYLDLPSEIYMAVEAMAEKNNVHVKYEVDKIREKVNELESAIYELVTPFEDKARDAENDYDDLDCAISDDMYWEKTA